MGVDDGVSKATTNNREERHTKIELERRSFAFGMDDEGQVEREKEREHQPCW